MQLLVLFAVLILYWLIYRYQQMRILKNNGIPGPPANLILGNIFQLQWNRKKALDYVSEWIKEYGRVISVYNVSGPTVIVADPELIRLIQVKDFSYFVGKRKLVHKGGLDANPDYEVGIVSTDLSDKRWKEQRSLIATAFSSSKIRASVPVTQQAVDALLNNISKHENGGDFNLYDYFQRFSMDTISRSAFGLNLDVQNHPENEFFIATKRVFDDLSRSILFLPLVLTFVFPEFFQFLYPIRRFIRVVRNKLGFPSHLTEQMEMCKRLVEERKAAAADPSVDLPDDILQRMIEASLTDQEMNQATLISTDDAYDRSENTPLARQKGKVHRMNDKEIAANASLLFDAGFETTSAFLGYLTHVLVNRQDVQQMVSEEVISLFEKEGLLDHNVVHGLPLLDSVVYETLRYFPSVTGFVNRRPSVDYHYKDMTIPAGTAVEIAVNFLHHDPELWDEPHIFDPMRFYGPNKTRANSPAFQAFGAGPRNCVGLRFALMEAKLAISRILRSYKLLPGPKTEAFDMIEIEYKPVTMNPKNGVFVRIEKL